MLVGDSTVGKTSLTKVYMGHEFIEGQNATIGMDFFKQVVRPKSAPMNQYQMNIWDTAGQERFQSLTRNFFRQSDAFIICFDLTRPDSFKSVTRWVLQIRDTAGADAPVLLIGNKVDLEEERVVTREQADALAAEI